MVTKMTKTKRRIVFGLLRNRAIDGGDDRTLALIAPALAYTKPRGPHASNANRSAWRSNMTTAGGHVAALREDALDVLRTSTDPNHLSTALRNAWPQPYPRGTGSAALEKDDIFGRHWMTFLCLFKPRGLDIDTSCEYTYRVAPNQARADAYASFLSELVQRKRRFDVSALYMTFPQCVREFVRAPRVLKGVFRLLCAIGVKLPTQAISELFDRRVLDDFDGVANATRRTAAWTRLFKLIRCIARTKAEKLYVVKRYIATVRNPVAREINDVVGHAKSLLSVADQAHFLLSVVRRQRPEPSAAVVRAVLGTLTRERLARLLAQYARLNARNRVQPRGNGSSGRLSDSVTTHLTNRLRTWGVLRNTRNSRR
jgi:hypothetical protein